MTCLLAMMMPTELRMVMAHASTSEIGMAVFFSSGSSNRATRGHVGYPSWNFCISTVTTAVIVVVGLRISTLQLD
jgi:hypothetical protein